MNRQRALRQRIRLALLLSSWLLFPATIFYFSPYLIIEASRVGIVNASLIVFGLMLLSALCFGRAYCGWLCPGGALGEAALPLNPRPTAPWLGQIKWVVWGLWIVTVAGFALTAGGYRQVDPFFYLTGGLSLLQPSWYIIFLVVNGLTLALSAWAGRRGFCHTVCWMAPFMVIGRRLGDALRLPALRLRAQPTACTGCQICTRGCPMSLPVHQLVQAGQLAHDDCILCGSCVDGCKHQAISFIVARPGALSIPLVAPDPSKAV